MYIYIEVNFPFFILAQAILKELGKVLYDKMSKPMQLVSCFVSVRLDLRNFGGFKDQSQLRITIKKF